MKLLHNLKERKTMLNKETIKNAVENVMMKNIFNNCPTMIHEKDYKVMNCVLCNAEMKTVHDTHNAFPLTEAVYAKVAQETNNKNRCCSDCNDEKVMTARIGNVPASCVVKMSMFDFMNSKSFGKTKSMYDVQDDDFYQTEFGKQYLKDKAEKSKDKMSLQKVRS